MPIANYTPEAKTGPLPANPVIAGPDYKGVVVDTKYTPVSSLLTYVKGASWTVNYYSQVIDKDNDIKSQDPGLNPIYQPYKLIKGYEIKVVNALTASQDNTTNATNITGSANIYPFLIPNVGDVFIADMGDGQDSIFVITNTEKRSHRKQSVYYIEYEFRQTISTNWSFYIDLERKVVETYEYVKDFLLYGQNPMVVSEEYAAMADLRKLYVEIIQNYFKWFYSNEYKTLLVPDTLGPTYDPRLTKFMLGICNTNDAPEIRNVKLLNLGEDGTLAQPCLWDGILKRDKNIALSYNIKAGIIPIEYFAADSMMNVARYTGIKNVVYPKPREYSAEDTVLIQDQTAAETPNHSNAAYRSLALVGNRVGFVNTAGDSVEHNGISLEVFPITFNTTALDSMDAVYKDTYVLSIDGYSNPPVGITKSAIEVVYSAYMDNERIDVLLVNKILANYVQWDKIRQFYFLPILLAVIKAALADL